MSSTDTSQAQKSNNKLIFAPGDPPPDSAAPASTTTPTPTPSRAAQFSLSRLRRSDLCPDPFTQFHSWFTSPQLRGHVPETVTLSTASLPSGRVSSRMVYLKELDSTGGFVVYSNFGTSRKSRDIASNPYASLCFWWKPLERQVRVEGTCQRLTPEESQVYFDTRARGSRIGAWASQQTSVLEPQPRPQNKNKANGTTETTEEEAEEEADDDDGRLDIENRVKEVEKRFEGQEHIPVPPFWGGLRIIPEAIEFWQGRESRLHDRFLYTRMDDSEGWKIERLSP
ncbi:pyridoxamine-phosphate oxidase [Exophiala xenobiotica]|nr:pyridoxamine-phosphate oxidase [Exophiala xenobiotica]